MNEIIRPERDTDSADIRSRDGKTVMKNIIQVDLKGSSGVFCLSCIFT